MLQFPLRIPSGNVVITKNFGRVLQDMQKESIVNMVFLKKGRQDLYDVLKDKSLVVRKPEICQIMDLTEYQEKIIDYGNIVVNFLEKNIDCPDDGVLLIVPIVYKILSKDSTNTIKNNLSLNTRIQSILLSGLDSAKICLANKEYNVNNAVGVVALVPYAIELGLLPEQCSDLIKAAAAILQPELEHMTECTPFLNAMKYAQPYITKMSCSTDDKASQDLLDFLKKYA